MEQLNDDILRKDLFKIVIFRIAAGTAIFIPSILATFLSSELFVALILVPMATIISAFFVMLLDKHLVLLLRAKQNKSLPMTSFKKTPFRPRSKPFHVHMKGVCPFCG